MKKEKDIPEKEIEKQVCLHATRLGWWTPKLILFPGRGFPDRTCIGFGAVFFIEFKRKGKKPSPRQVVVFKILMDAGHKVLVIDSVEKGKKLINEITLRTKELSEKSDSENS